LVTHIKGGTQAESVREWGIVEDIWPNGGEVKTERRKLRNEELNDPYCSPKFVRVIKSRRMRRARHVARMGERRGAYRVLV
jgi:hypothetical protein